MFFGNDTDRLLKRFFSDPFGFELDTCDGSSGCGINQDKSDVSLRSNPSVRYYGFVATMGPDGRPIVREYGNMGSVGHKLSEQEGYLQDATQSRDAREPLMDTIVDEKEKVLKLIAEMPGVEKSDIKITVNKSHVSVSTDTHNDGKKYQMQIPLEHKVDANSAKATYRNGILQITFDLVKGPQDGKTIKVD